MSDLQVLDRACEDWTWPMWLVIEKLWFLLNLLILFIILSIQAFMSLCHKYSHFAIDTQFHLPQATTREWFWPFFAFNSINRYEIETHSHYWLEIEQRLIHLRTHRIQNIREMEEEVEEIERNRIHHHWNCVEEMTCSKLWIIIVIVVASENKNKPKYDQGRSTHVWAASKHSEYAARADDNWNGEHRQRTHKYYGLKL